MTALRPDQFEKVASRLQASIDAHIAELVDAYAKAHEAAWSGVVRENAGKVTSGGPADPVAGIVGDPLDRQHPGLQRAIRKELENAPTTLQGADNMISGIAKKIELAMERLSPREGFQALRYPRSASDADLEEAREAQQRRTERGETG